MQLMSPVVSKSVFGFSSIQSQIKRTYSQINRFTEWNKEQIKWVCSIFGRYVGAKSSSLSLLGRSLQVFSYPFVANGMVKAQKSATGYQPQFKILEKAECWRLLPYSVIGSFAYATHKEGEETWLNPFGWRAVKPNELGLDPSSFPADLKSFEYCFMDVNNPLKMMVMERGDECVIGYGAVASVAVEFSKDEEKSERLKKMQDRQAIKNLLGLQVDTYDTASKMTEILLNSSYVRGKKKVVLAGQCLGASLAQFCALDLHQKSPVPLTAKCFNPLPIGAGQQWKLSKEKFTKAESLIEHVATESDFVSDPSLSLVWIDRFVSLLGFKTPASWGRSYKIPTAYPDSHSDTHNYFFASMLHYMGFYKRLKPNTLPVEAQQRAMEASVASDHLDSPSKSVHKGSNLKQNSKSKHKKVDQLLKHILKISISGHSFRFSMGPSITALSNEQLVELHKKLSACLEENPSSNQKLILETHLFFTEDIILRRSLNNSDERSQFLQSFDGNPLAIRIEESSSRFLPLAPKSGAPVKTQQIADQKIQNPTNITSENTNTSLPRVFKAVLEGKVRNRVAGVGSVIRGLHQAHNELEDHTVSSVHPLYLSNAEVARSWKFIGEVTHQYEGKLVKSSVYRDSATSEYHIAPDPSFAHVFNIPLTSSGVYENSSDSSHTERVVYFGSAVAAMASLFCGKKGSKQADILQVDSNTVAGVAFPLYETIYGKMRMEAGLKPLKRLLIMHGKLEESMHVQPSTLVSTGASQFGDRYLKVELVRQGMKDSDHVCFVSNNLASQALSTNPHINGGCNLVLDPSKVSAIRNGVDSSRFDPTNEKTFGPLALKRTFVGDVETTDYEAYRARLRQMLYESGWIKDPKKKLCCSTGRLAMEKNIPQLAQIIQNNQNPNVQFVVMGIAIGILLGSSVSDLKKMAATSHKDTLRLILTQDEQNTLFVHNGVTYPCTVAQVLRAAADFGLITSRREPCGLVHMEDLCTGSLEIGTYIDGLQDSFKPVGFPSPSGEKYTLEKDANAFCFRDPENSTEALETFHNAVDAYERMSKEERNKLAQRLRNESVKEFSWLQSNSEKGASSGAVFRYRALYERLSGKKFAHIESTDCSTVQDPIVPIAADLQNYGLISKIGLVFQRIISYIVF